eukprot:13013250-Alexandrium_andersonii.AAC.1
MFANEEAPELQSEAAPDELRFGHPEPVGDGTLHSGVWHSARLGYVEPQSKVRSGLLAQCSDGFELLLRP